MSIPFKFFILSTPVQDFSMFVVCVEDMYNKEPFVLKTTATSASSVHILRLEFNIKSL